MPKPNGRLEAARLAYRAALDAARQKPSQEAWARLLAAGRELSIAEQPPPRSRRRRQPERPAEIVVESEAPIEPELSLEREPELERT